MPEQVVFKMDLEIRKLISWNHSIQAGTTKSLYYVIGFYLKKFLV